MKPCNLHAYALNFVEGNVVATPVVELGCARRRVIGHSGWRVNQTVGGHFRRLDRHHRRRDGGTRWDTALGICEVSNEKSPASPPGTLAVSATLATLPTDRSCYATDQKTFSLSGSVLRGHQQRVRPFARLFCPVDVVGRAQCGGPHDRRSLRSCRPSMATAFLAVRGRAKPYGRVRQCHSNRRRRCGTRRRWSETPAPRDETSRATLH